MLNQNYPLLKAAFIERGNPILQSPDSNLVRKAFSKLEFKVVIEEFMTDTASLADVILPAKNMFKQSDIIGSYWSPYVQFKPKITDPQGDVRPESEIYYELACRLKLDLPVELIPEPGNVNIEKWLENRIEGYTYLRLDDLRQGPVLAPGLQEIAYSDMRFDTPSGKIELYSEEASARWNVSALPEYVPVKCPEIKDKYPLAFITPNKGSRIHSQFGNLTVIKENEEEPALLISHSDAEKRKIFTGNMVRVFNSFGELSCRARVTNRLPSGSVLLPNGIWLNEGGGGNHLIEGRETDMGHGAAFHDNMVEVEKTDLE
jgi:anaerobic selenocysteine-containing dehydrogenase